MALLTVLWSVALLSIIAVSFLTTGNVAYRLARNALEIAQADATADAAVNRAALALLEQRPERKWRVDGVPQAFDFNGERVRVAIQDELGRIDLNFADGPLLIGLLQSAGLDNAAAASLADKILDWRDTGSLKRLNGAKEQDYRLAGRTYRPRNGPFQSIDELKLVIDMTPALFRRVEPAITVYSGKQFIDPQVAPAEALLALPGMDANKVAALITTRRTQAAAQLFEGLASAPATGRAFTIRTELERSPGVLARETVIRMTDNPAQPFWVLSWKSK